MNNEFKLYNKVINYNRYIRKYVVNNIPNIHRDLRIHMLDENYNMIKCLYKSEYSKGFQSGRLSSILHYLDDSFYVINNKTVYTIKALSWMFGDEAKIDTDLKHYIDNNEYYKKFLKRLNNVLNYSEFDIMISIHLIVFAIGCVIKN